MFFHHSQPIRPPGPYTDSHGQWHRGGRDLEGYSTGGGKIYSWLVLACSIPFWLVLQNTSSRGDNFLFKNIKNFKIHKKFTELGWFEIRISHETIDLLDFHWFSFVFVKGNQWKSSKSMVSWEITISHRHSSVNFLWILKIYIFLNRKLSPLELVFCRTGQN